MRRFTAQIEPRWRITTFFLLMINHNANITIQERTENFAIRVIKAYCELTKRPFDDAGKVLSKQFLRSGTSIGAIISITK